MDYLKLSKEVSYALRHAPWEYELELDENGWVDIEQLVNSLRNKGEWNNLSSSELINMVIVSDKKRHEICNDKIRALYGHSVPQKIDKERKQPPDILYHGTKRCSIASIMNGGLMPKQRQYVHLSVDTNTALEVGKRRDDEPIILRILAGKAWKDGVVFYKGNDKVWLADCIPSTYIEIT